jgi:hypothetical protein
MPRPKADFRWSTLAECRAAGLDDLVALHWEEVEDHHDVSPLDMDWPRYADLERRGDLKIGALWSGGDLVGYNVFFVYRPIHFRRTVWAISDGIWLDPAHRGPAGIRLIVEAEQGLREMGARVILYSVKDGDDLSSKRHRGSVGELLRRLGYVSFDRSWSKAL